MLPTFPASVESVEEWLEHLQLQRYNKSFAALGVHDLPNLDDEQLVGLGVAIVGHRKRILIGAKSLVPMPSPPLTTAPPNSIASSSTHGPKSTVSSGRTSVSHGTAETAQLLAARRPRGESIESAIRRRLAPRIVPLLVLLSVCMCGAIAPRLPHHQGATVYIVGWWAAIAAVGASFWPTDELLRSGWGWKFTMALHGSLGLTLSRVAFEVWPLTTQYPLASQGALHRLSTTVYLAYIVSAFILALVGRVSWWHIRLLFAVFPSNRFLPLVGLHVLEVLSASTPSLEAGSLSGEKTVLLLRRPTHACFYTICRASDTVAQAWLLAGVEVIAVCLIALLSSPGNRRFFAKHSGLAHVRLRLGEIRGLSSAEEAEERGGPSPIQKYLAGEAVENNEAVGNTKAVGGGEGTAPAGSERSSEKRRRLKVWWAPGHPHVPPPDEPTRDDPQNAAATLYGLAPSGPQILNSSRSTAPAAPESYSGSKSAGGKLPIRAAVREIWSGSDSSGEREKGE